MYVLRSKNVSILVPRLVNEENRKLMEGAETFEPRTLVATEHNDSWEIMQIPDMLTTHTTGYDPLDDKLAVALARFVNGLLNQGYAKQGMTCPECGTKAFTAADGSWTTIAPLPNSRLWQCRTCDFEGLGDDFTKGPPVVSTTQTRAAEELIQKTIRAVLDQLRGRAIIDLRPEAAAALLPAVLTEVFDEPEEKNDTEGLPTCPQCHSVNLTAFKDPPPKGWHCNDCGYASRIP